MKEIVVNNMEKNTWNHLKVNNTKIVAPYIEKEDIEKYISLKEKNIIIRNDYEEEITNDNNTASEIIEEFTNLDKNFSRNNGYVVHEINSIKEEKTNILTMKKTDGAIPEDKEVLNYLEEAIEKEDNNKIIYEKENILFASKNDETHMIEIDNNNIAIKELNIILEENSSSNIMILVNENDKKTYRDIKIKISGKDNSSANIIIMYGIGRNTFSLDSVYVEGKNSNIHMTYVFLGSDNQYIKHTTNCMENAKITVDGMYILDDRNILDMMYMAKHEEKNGNTNLLLEGAMLDNSSKLFKGIIDFKKGSTGSVADEKETVMLLSDEAKQKSLPILLSSESDITGNHAATVGKIDEKKLFYLKSRGIDEEEAAGLLILANFEKILLNIYDENLRKTIKNILVGSIISKKN